MAFIDQLNTAKTIDARVRSQASVAKVKQSATVAVKNSAGADSHNGTASVSGDALTDVKLAATVAMVDNGDKIPATGSGAVATAVVANGVITGVTLAAS